MKEDIIKFETANLAEEKGYPFTYVPCDEVGNIPTNIPTQSLLQKWLREKHHIDITVMIRFSESYGFYIHKGRNIPNDFKEIIVDPTPENTKTGIYENTLELALQKALELI